MPAIPATLGAEEGGMSMQDQPGKLTEIFFLSLLMDACMCVCMHFKRLGYLRMVEHLPRMCKGVGSISSIGETYMHTHTEKKNTYNTNKELAR